ADQQRHVAVAQLLAESAESLLDAGEVSAVRRMLVRAGEDHQLRRARIVLPDGAVLADADARRISVDLVRASFADHDADFDKDTVAVSSGMLVIHQPLQVTGRGSARLEIMADISPAHGSMLEMHAGIGAIGVTALLALLLVYRHYRHRMQAIGVIREALLAMNSGEGSAAALAVAGDLGGEAAAWNQLLAEQTTLRQQSQVQNTREALGGDGANGDLANACDAVSHGLLLVDDRCRLRYVNHAACVFLQAKREALTGTAVRDVIQPADFAEMIEKVANGTLRRKSTTQLQRGEAGAAGMLRASVHPVRGRQGATAMVVLEDVTQQHVAEQASQQFVAQATHELRTPLTNIRLYLETLLDDDDADAQTQARCLNVINQETGRLERLVGDMLSVAEIEAGSMQIQQDDVRVDTVLHGIEQEFQAQAEEKRVTLTFNIAPKLPIVQGDRDKLAMALHNLVGNAMKYTMEGGQVNVRVEAEDEHLSVVVADTGLGIAPDDLERVFERFYRAQDKRINGITGSGLGLALARDVARLHGGDITVESQVDQGSTFTLTLPAHEDAATATE
ncbi:MAG: ATP-binding protein, partial [Phycisphaeraceae bacterium]